MIFLFRVAIGLGVYLTAVFMTLAAYYYAGLPGIIPVIPMAISMGIGRGWILERVEEWASK